MKELDLPNQRMCKKKPFGDLLLCKLTLKYSSNKRSLNGDTLYGLTFLSPEDIGHSVKIRLPVVGYL